MTSTDPIPETPFDLHAPDERDPQRVVQYWREKAMDMAKRCDQQDELIRDLRGAVELATREDRPMTVLTKPHPETLHKLADLIWGNSSGLPYPQLASLRVLSKCLSELAKQPQQP